MSEIIPQFLNSLTAMEAAFYTTMTLAGSTFVSENVKQITQRLWKIHDDRKTKDIVPPEPHILVPAIQAMAYTYSCDELYNMYANLLVSATTLGDKHRVHPAFTEIIKQLSPLDAQILDTLDNYKADWGCGSLVYLHNNGQTSKEIMKYYFPFRELNKDNYKLYDASISNLIRLQLIEFNVLRYFTHSSRYEHMENTQLYKEFLAEPFPEDMHLHFNKSYFDFTPFGKEFTSICLDKKMAITFKSIE